MNHYTFDNFISDVKLYSESYLKLENAQKDITQKFIPQSGDQKTGVIGEAYIYQYLNAKGLVDLTFGSASEKGWDIKFKKNIIDSQEYKVQVKTVSGFSSSRKISPIHDGWDFLYLISLDRSFKPNGLWCINQPDQLKWNIKVKSNNNIVKFLSGKKMRNPNSKCPTSTGSEDLFKIATNEIDDFWKYMKKYFQE